jgi:protein phosphatase 1D
MCIVSVYKWLFAATESKKRKAKDWEADDYYDSDEDTFLDRTGTVEKKRQQRMRAAGKRDPGEVIETYSSLVSIYQYCDFLEEGSN